MGEALARGPAALDRDFWRDRRVFLTGHTGFIGGWAAVVMQHLGAQVYGYSLAPPTTPSFYESTGLGRRTEGRLADVRDRTTLDAAFATARPEIVLHLAAQPLVSAGYANPVETFEVNVQGTVNLLDCVRRHGATAVIVMTTDKVYRDPRSENCEGERLGARDPYGGSKVCCEIVAEAYGRSFLAPAGVPLATVRAGNVVGGGDWAPDRLLPDAVRAFSTGRPLALRRPDAARPWQHVLDAVYGLLLVAQATAACRTGGPDAWNVGPPSGKLMTVGEIAALAAMSWGQHASIINDGERAFEETGVLTLSSQRIRRELGYAEPWGLPLIVDRTIGWYRNTLAGLDPWELSRREVVDYLAAPVADAEAQ
jgi:CDP-glucose 4,6-dehydratase